MEGNLKSNQALYNLKGKVTDVPFVDSTLKKEGYAADAKVTGDELERLKAEVERLAAVVEH